jgi:hypothetical protein
MMFHRRHGYNVAGTFSKICDIIDVCFFSGYSHYASQVFTRDISLPHHRFGAFLWCDVEWGMPDSRTFGPRPPKDDSGERPLTRWLGCVFR